MFIYNPRIKQSCYWLIGRGSWIIMSSALIGCFTVLLNVELCSDWLFHSVMCYVWSHMFLQLTLWIDTPPPRQRLHLVDKLITAWEFNAHVQYAHTILMTRFTSCALYAVPKHTWLKWGLNLNFWLDWTVPLIPLCWWKLI